MAILDWTKSRIALFLAGSHTNYPTYFMIGSGSGTVTAAQTTLFNPTDRQTNTSVDSNTAYKVKWTGDWNSIEMSGTALGWYSLREWSLCTSGPTTTGSMWSKTAMADAINFDGTNELRIEENWEVY